MQYNFFFASNYAIVSSSEVLIVVVVDENEDATIEDNVAPDQADPRSWSIQGWCLHE